MRTAAFSPVSQSALRAGALALLAAVGLSACASSSALRGQERLEIYRAHAGEPVDSIHYFGRYNGWTPLTDTSFALWTRPSKAYLIEVYGPCSNLDYAERLSFRDNDGFLSARFDDVYAHGGLGIHPIPCRIKEIRPLDMKAVRSAEKAARDARERGETLPPAGGSGAAAAG
jgi:hypothetical protein